MVSYPTAQRNPYIIGRPISEADKFFGRESLFKAIEDYLRQGKRVILLNGQRRIGTSSLLQQLPEQVALDNFIFVNFDLQDKSHSSLTHILNNLAAEITAQIELDDIEIPSIEGLENNSDIFGRDFLLKVYQKLENKNIVLLLDEFDAVDNSNHDILNLGCGFFPYLNRLIKEQERLFIIPVVGRFQNDLKKLRELFQNPPYQEVDLLDNISAKRLIIKPAAGVLEYNEDAIQAILELSAGHPYFTQVLCFNIFGYARSEDNWKVTRANVKMIVDKAIESAEGALSWFWDGLTTPQKVIFSAVAEAQNNFSPEDKIFSEVPLRLVMEYGVIKTEELANAVKELTEKSLLDESQLKVKIEFVRRWLEQRHPLRNEITDLEKLKAEEIEPLLQKAGELLQQGKKQDVLGIYEEILTLNPNHFSTLSLLAEEYIKTENFDKAIELHKRIYQVDPIRNKEGLLSALESYGNTLIEKQDFIQAAGQFQRVLEIEPHRISAQQKMREVEAEIAAKTIANNQVMADNIADNTSPELVYEVNSENKILLQDSSHPVASALSISVTNSNIKNPSNQYKSSIILFFKLVAVLAVVPGIVGISFFISRWLTPCPSGQQKVNAISCEALLSDIISSGERTLFDTSNRERNKGIEAFKERNYSQAIELFESSRKVNPNNPEVLIYQNNAKARKQGKPLTLAVIVPVDNAQSIAQEILRGVAQAQDQFNNSNGLKGKLLEIVIANDANEPKQATQVAQQLVNNPSVLGVIGHDFGETNSSALGIYEMAGLPVISSTSAKKFLNNNVLFTTVPSEAANSKQLAEYTIEDLSLNKVVIFYNSNSFDSNILREEFTNSFKQLGGQVVQEFDLKSQNLNINKKLEASVVRYQAQAALLFPDSLPNTSVVLLEIAKAKTNSKNPQVQNLQLLAGDALYNEKVLKEGGKQIEGLILAIPWFREAPQSQNFVKEAKNLWKENVSWRTATSFDATQALIQALSFDASRSTVLQNLRKVNLPPNNTSGYPLHFTPDGARQSQPVLVKITKGKFRAIVKERDSSD
ncbi:ABC transporter substrate-binding protein [Nostoc sp. LEGE 12447]|uniref:ABC transporter substrate-binding protein n=1 Tax=Nostoc sp. LEGE 12447 TaxID=1828640 RepID=UPI001883C70D|nr:ABC transporter substrate-binding protein [Nostoc sp. LEGE 12447]MBE9002740.1 ABC transporter substrate-binding protein [Nostoc sp. LEGE 12447]